MWNRLHIIPFIGGQFDGQRERIYLVRTPAFEPARRSRGSSSTPSTSSRCVVDARRDRGRRRSPLRPADPRQPTSRPCSPTVHRRPRSTSASDAPSFLSRRRRSESAARGIPPAAQLEPPRGTRSARWDSEGSGAHGGERGAATLGEVFVVVLVGPHDRRQVAECVTGGVEPAAVDIRRVERP